MTYDIAGKVALVTGGGNGIGRAICVALAQNGAKVVIIDKNAEDGLATMSGINENSKHLSSFIQCDVADVGAFNPIIEDVSKRFGKLDILVNNAGTVDESEAGWKSMVDLNLISVIETCRLVIDKYMSHGGVIVNISSIAANTATSFPIYAATKGGVTAFSISLGGKSSFERTKVRVMAIQPGMTKTNLSNCATWISKQWIQGYSADSAVEERHGPAQGPEKVAECLVEALRIGLSGSIWTVVNGEWTVENFE